MLIQVRSTQDSLTDVRSQLSATSSKLTTAQTREKQLMDELSTARHKVGTASMSRQMCSRVQVTTLEARAEKLANEKAIILQDQSDSGKKL